MITLTIKIDKRTKKGKAFLELAKPFFEDGKDIELVDNKNAYNQEFVDKLIKKKTVVTSNNVSENV